MKRKSLIGFIAFCVAIIWLLLEDSLRWLIFENQSHVLFLTDTKDVSLYSLIGVLIVFFLQFYIDGAKNLKFFEVSTKNIAILYILIFLLPLPLLQVRTEITEDKIITYNVVGNIAKERSIKDAECVNCKLEYHGQPDIPNNNVRFSYTIVFSNDEIHIYLDSNEKLWQNIQLLDKKIIKHKIEKNVFGYEYINTIREFNLIDRTVNKPFGVYSNIDIIESIMQQDSR